MAGIQDTWTFTDDFIGNGSLPTSATAGTPWVIDDTSSSGTPTYVYVDGSLTGEVAIDFDSQSEVQNVALHFGDVLCMDIDKIKWAEFRVKMNQSALDAATMLAVGLIGDRNDTVDDIAQAALFRVVGSDDTDAVVVETDDGTNDNDDKATGQTLVDSYKRLRIDFSQGTDDVRFYMDDGNGALKRVASSTTFDMSNYTGSLQPLVQLQKTADSNTDGVTVDYVHVEGKR